MTNLGTFVFGYRMHTGPKAVNCHVMIAIPLGDIVDAMVLTRCGYFDPVLDPDGSACYWSVGGGGGGDTASWNSLLDPHCPTSHILAQFCIHTYMNWLKLKPDMITWGLGKWYIWSFGPSVNELLVSFWLTVLRLLSTVRHGNNLKSLLLGVFISMNVLQSNQCLHWNEQFV